MTYTDRHRAALRELTHADIAIGQAISELTHLSALDNVDRHEVTEALAEAGMAVDRAVASLRPVRE